MRSRNQADGMKTGQLIRGSPILQGLSKGFWVLPLAYAPVQRFAKMMKVMIELRRDPLRVNLWLEQPNHSSLNHQAYTEDLIHVFN